MSRQFRLTVPDGGLVMLADAVRLAWTFAEAEAEELTAALVATPGRRTVDQIVTHSDACRRADRLRQFVGILTAQAEARGLL